MCRLQCRPFSLSWNRWVVSVKAYIIPQADVINVKVQPILADSLGFGDNVENTVGACPRKHNIEWEEDEDF